MFKKTPLEPWIYGKINGQAGEAGRLTRGIDRILSTAKAENNDCPGRR
jgi:hypothetical protein